MRGILVPGHNCDRGREMTMRNRYPRVGGHGNGRTDSRHNLKRGTGLRQRQRLFTTTPKDERVAAFQSHHYATLLGILNEQRVYLLLFHTVVAGPLADIDALGLWMRLFKQLRA